MKKIVSAALLGALLAGCGGGGSSLVPSASQSGTKSAQQVQVAFSIAIPRAGSSSKRRPAYIAPATQSAVVDVTAAGAPTTRTIITCGNSACNGSVPATVGTDTFVITLNDRPDGSGKTLASGSTTSTVAAGQANAVTVTFNGVVASLMITFDQPNPPVNASSTITVRVAALDADGSTIVGPGTYDNPITVTDGDASGASSMTPVTLNAPSDPPFTVSYNGAWIGGDCACIPIIASVPKNAAVKPVTAQVIPAPQAVEYTIPTANSAPTDLAKGSDGAIWFTEESGHQIGRVTTSGSFTEYAVPSIASVTYPVALPWAITAGGDGNLWFTDNSQFGQAIDSITTSGAVTRYSIARQYTTRNLFQMVWGPDGNLWAPDTSTNQIVRFTPAGVETDFAIPQPNSNTQNIANGPDGAMWFTEMNAAKIARIATDGTIKEYSTLAPASGNNPSNISEPGALTAGPDGALWYVDNWLNVVGHATTSGTVTQFPRTGNTVQSPIITGPDGAVYFGAGGGYIGRISAKGTQTTIPIAKLRQRGGQAFKFAIGSDGNIWYVDTYGNVVGKLVF